jgi:pimeloyl-ACP methyl ester carboxylesterase
MMTFMMKPTIKTIIFATMVGIAVLLPAPARALPPIPQPCVDGTLPSGALSLICVPLGWNGQLVVFAHGYVAPEQPIAFYNLALPDGTSLPDLIQSLGFAFATTSYRQNGLAILEGADDIRELVAEFGETHSPLRTYVTGVSEGGLVAALLAERSPELFFSGLATCGPIGSFLAQIDYFGDFRVLFDYFFPGIIPGSPIRIPADVMTTWYTVYVPEITAALAANPSRAVELLRVAHAPYDPTNPATIVNTALDVLWYNTFATNDAVHKLGGNPFGNRLRWYFGSSDDFRLNQRVERFAASPAALTALRPYETSGRPSIPLVTLHTTGDDVIPIWQELLYLLKFDPSGRGRFIPVPVLRYGHCNFTTNEVLDAFLHSTGDFLQTDASREGTVSGGQLRTAEVR